MNTLRPSTSTSSPPLRTLLSPHPRVVPRYLTLACASPPPSAAPLLSSPSTHWLVLTDRPPALSKAEVIEYYVATLAEVLGSEREAQACIYDASWQNHFGFCCDVDEETSNQLASLPNVLSVRRDASPESSKDYSFSSSLLDQLGRADRQITKFMPSGSGGNGKYWLVQMEKPGVEVVTKANMVDYYTHILAEVLGNEQDAQVSIYNISWEKNFGFCCHIDEDCAEELSVVPGVMFVRPDLHYDSQYKDYGGIAIPHKEDGVLDPSKSNQITDIKTKRLFVTGLSFYTSEKTLRAAFEGFGELVEVKVIMDKISKRSKGYAFIEYKTEAAAGAALKEMNGKIINGWMIVVDVAKTNPQKISRGRPHTP